MGAKALGASYQKSTTPQDVKGHYDLMSLPYRIFWGEHLHHGLFLSGNESARQAQLQLLEYCSGLVEIRPTSKVLDIGCGYGGTAIYMVRNFGCNVEGLTISPKQGRIALRRAQRAGVAHRIAVRICDVERICFQSEYDLIWMMESSEHLHDKRDCIEKAARSLRSGGRMMIAAWSGSMAEPLIREIAGLAVCPAFQTADDYETQLRDSGLRITDVRDLSDGVLPTWKICQRRTDLVRPFCRVLPSGIREFISAIPLLIEAYRTGLMSYTVIVAEKP